MYSNDTEATIFSLAFKAPRPTLPTRPPHILSATVLPCASRDALPTEAQQICLLWASQGADFFVAAFAHASEISPFSLCLDASSNPVYVCLFL